VIRNIRYAFRALRKTPGFTALALTVLSLGVAVNTAVFSLVNAVVLRPLPYAEPDRLVTLDEYAPKRGIPSMGTAFPNFLDYRAGNSVFQDVAAYFSTQPTLGAADLLPAERVAGARVSYSTFDLLGVRPFRGRTFRNDEDRAGAPRVGVLGYQLWQRRYGGDESIVGRSVIVDGRDVTIVGIMPPGFRFPEVAEYWRPMSLDPKEGTRTDHFMRPIARLKPGVSHAQAQADDLKALPGVRSVAAATPLPYRGGWWRSFSVEGRAVKLEDVTDAYHSLVTPEYFRTLGIAIRRGRRRPGAGGDHQRLARAAVLSRTGSDRPPRPPRAAAERGTVARHRRCRQRRPGQRAAPRSARDRIRAVLPASGFIRQVCRQDVR
jgi:hypothetical protein